MMIWFHLLFGTLENLDSSFLTTLPTTNWNCGISNFGESFYFQGAAVNTPAYDWILIHVDRNCEKQTSREHLEKNHYSYMKTHYGENEALVLVTLVACGQLLDCLHISGHSL